MNEQAQEDHWTAYTKSEQHLKERIAYILAVKPYLSASTLALRVGCSRATAGKWKRRIEQEKRVTS